MSNPLPFPLARAWAFRAVLMARGYTDAEIAISLTPTLPGMTGSGVITTTDPRSPTLAICVTVSRGDGSWSVPLAPWTLEPELIEPAVRSLRAADARGEITPAMLAPAEAAMPFDPTWLTTELEARNMPTKAVP